jgi:hypothetical protein
MSAYIVDRSDIKYLIDSADILSRTGFAWYGADGWETMTDKAKTAQMLWDENIKSVCARYSCKPQDAPGPGGDYKYGRHDIRTKPVNPLAVLKAISHYEYQSCEHVGWKESSAKRFCESLRRVAIQSIPGYENAYDSKE